MGACDNRGDLEELAPLQAGEARQLAANCALTQCSSLVGMESEFKVCVSECVAAAPSGLSPSCADCYGDMAWCSGLSCNTACANAPCQLLCLQTCDAGQNPQCISDLSQCAGRISVDCGET
jgi:hypothetical protein